MEGGDILNVFLVHLLLLPPLSASSSICASKLKKVPHSLLSKEHDPRWQLLVGWLFPKSPHRDGETLKVLEVWVRPQKSGGLSKGLNSLGLPVGLEISSQQAT